VGLISANHNSNDYDKWDKADPIRVGNNVWIGMNSVVLPGVTIGSNVIVGANSVVKKDIPDNCIAIGNPCQVVRHKPPYTGFNYTRKQNRYAYTKSQKREEL
jgi:acetyltransferase-like isoleucine patch superfamily enzyme